MSGAVVAVGARTAIGLDARQTGFLLRAGFPALGQAPIADAAGEAITMAFLPTIDGRLTGPERLSALAAAPFAEAAEHVTDLAVEVRVFLDEGYAELIIARGMLEAMIKRVIPAATVSVEARGEAALGAALPAAMKNLASRRVDAVILGGVHSDYDPAAIAALEASGRLFATTNLDARIPGEAAAFVLLMREGDAARMRLAPLARVMGTGTGVERARPDNDAPAYEALGLTAAVRAATEPLAKTGQTAGWMLTDLTSEMRRLYEWESAWVRAQKVLGRPYIIESPAQRIGYLGAAALPLFVAMAATAWQHGYAPSPTALAIAGADGGERAALTLQKA